MDDKEQLKKILQFFAFGMLLILLMVVFFQKKSLKKQTTGQRKESKIEIQDGDNIITIRENGTAEFKSPNEVFYQNWDKNKTKAIFDYLGQKVGKQGYDFLLTWDGEKYKVGLMTEEGQIETNIFIDSDDKELADILEDVGGLAEDGGGDDSLSDYFDFPSPTPKGDEPEDNGGSDGDGGSSDDSDDDGGYSGGGDDSGGGSSGHDDCPFWLLSYCVYPRDWSPAPTSTALPTASPIPPQPTPVVVEECTLWEHLINERTVISQNVCVKEEE